MARITSFSLGPELDAFVREQVTSKAYGSASEVLRAALTAMQDEKLKQDALLAALDEGLASGRARPGTWKRVRAAVKKRLL
ncbi:MAG: type II toxin-antitoxin system ParD family antitoxin [Myxococcaceae bacterium]|nr:type II toxin-antitoxin system ParD family antitoxin [Myxococcaceae bacterium]